MVLEFFAHKKKKMDAVLLRLLRKIDRSGGLSLGASIVEPLSINGLIEFGGPREGIPYNDYHLSAIGWDRLRELEAEERAKNE